MWADVIAVVGSTELTTSAAFLVAGVVAILATLAATEGSRSPAYAGFDGAAASGTVLLRGAARTPAASTLTEISRKIGEDILGEGTNCG